VTGWDPAAAATWEETPAGRFRAAMGGPRPDYAAETFAAELPGREAAAREFRIAWDLEDGQGRPTVKAELAAALRDQQAAHLAGVHFGPPMSDDEVRTGLHNMKLDVLARSIAPTSLAHRGSPSPAELDAWRANVLRGIA
jgi:hypothetical protein